MAYFESDFGTFFCDFYRLAVDLHGVDRLLKEHVLRCDLDDVTDPEGLMEFDDCDLDFFEICRNLSDRMNFRESSRRLMPHLWL